MKKNVKLIITLIIVNIFGKIILQDNFNYYFKIWITLICLGLVFFPIVMKIFKNFQDKGWIISKVIGLGISGLCMFLVSYAKILKFSVINCYVIIGILLCVSLIIFVKDKSKLDYINIIKNILITEIIFCISFITWTYIRSYNVAINNTTEQFMNYGYMNKIMNSDYMPPEDIWFSGHNINYYYFGQYMCAFLSKISYLNVNEGYNICLALLASFTFTLPYSITVNIVKNSNIFKDKIKTKYIIAILTGLSICIGGTLYYPIYKTISNVNGEQYNYWGATRYIGYKPETNDKTITDIPSYSNVVGDLHAHYVDTMFVFVNIAILFAMLSNEKLNNNKKRLCNLSIILLGIILGIQKMTNYWDFPIYAVIIVLTIIANNMTKYKFSKKNVSLLLIQIIEIFLIEELITFPFSKDLYISATQVNFTHVMSPLYKLLVLWGFPILCYIVFICNIFIKSLKNNNKMIDKIKAINISDIFIIIIGICAVGLIILPEVIYLKDIYSDEYKRANTMFKLTYQAYILFSFSTPYIIIKYLIENKNKCKKIFSLVMLILQISTLGYGINAINYATKNGKYKKNISNSELYIQTYYPEDYNAIKWIQNNIDKNKIIVETTGESYTMGSRVSVFTGNPTVLGWYAHEWIWRAENYKPPKEELERYSDINELYSTTDTERIKNIIKKYNISYVFFGNMEYEKNYEPNTLLSIGDIVYQQTDNYSRSPVYVIKIEQ